MTQSGSLAVFASAVVTRCWKLLPLGTTCRNMLNIFLAQQDLRIYISIYLYVYTYIYVYVCGHTDT